MATNEDQIVYDGATRILRFPQDKKREEFLKKKIAGGDDMDKLDLAIKHIEGIAENLEKSNQRLQDDFREREHRIYQSNKDYEDRINKKMDSIDSKMDRLMESTDSKMDKLTESMYAGDRSTQRWVIGTCITMLFALLGAIIPLYFKG